MCGFNTQDTILGIYNYNNKEKIVCGCKDFLDDNHTLLEFEKLALSTNPDKKIDTEINDIMETIMISSIIINKDEIINFFYEMFIIDALIGNTNRHNGNWGFIIDKDNNYTISKVYDCGSCLNPLLDDEDINKLNDNEIKNLAINSYSCLKENGKKINYISYIKEMKNEECNKALIKVFNNINLNKIIDFINNIDCISDIRKRFYISLLETRYNILGNVYKKLL